METLDSLSEGGDRLVSGYLKATVDRSPTMRAGRSMAQRSSNLLSGFSQGFWKTAAVPTSIPRIATLQ
jgi:hypothetical protein